jgi:hypothetical protein
MKLTTPFAIALVVCCFGSATTHLHAQASKDDIFAAFCLGVAQFDLSQAQKMAGGGNLPNDPATTRFTEQIVNHAQARVSRFQTYLVARGHLNPDAASVEIMAAQRHGLDAAQNCWDQAGVIANRCRAARKQDSIDRCIRDAAPAECQQVTRCRQSADHLPP